MKPKGFDLYNESLYKLINREVQVVFVTTEPGIGTITHANEYFAEADVPWTDIRCSQLMPEEMVPRSKGGVSYLRTKVRLCDNSGHIVILDEADVLFEKTERLHELVEMIEAGCRLVIVCKDKNNVLKNALAIPVELRAPVLPEAHRATLKWGEPGKSWKDYR